eukprot:scaffold84858_cov74-Cyclotella_meneghiniana.AAC.3
MPLPTAMPLSSISQQINTTFDSSHHCWLILRAGDVEFGRGVNCEFGDGADLRRAETFDVSASADAQGYG